MAPTFNSYRRSTTRCRVLFLSTKQKHRGKAKQQGARGFRLKLQQEHQKQKQWEADRIAAATAAQEVTLQEQQPSAVPDASSDAPPPPRNQTEAPGTGGGGGGESPAAAGEPGASGTGGATPGGEEAPTAAALRRCPKVILDSNITIGLCKVVRLGQQCRHGSRCNYAHSAAEVRVWQAQRDENWNQEQRRKAARSKAAKEAGRIADEKQLELRQAREAAGAERKAAAAQALLARGMCPKEARRRQLQAQWEVSRPFRRAAEANKRVAAIRKAAVAEEAKRQAKRQAAEAEAGRIAVANAAQEVALQEAAARKAAEEAERAQQAQEAARVLREAANEALYEREAAILMRVRVLCTKQ